MAAVARAAPRASCMPHHAARAGTVIIIHIMLPQPCGLEPHLTAEASTQTESSVTDINRYACFSHSLSLFQLSKLTHTQQIAKIPTLRTVNRQQHTAVFSSRFSDPRRDQTISSPLNEWLWRAWLNLRVAAAR